MRDLRILKETEEKPSKKKKLPTLLIAFMGILVFLALFFLFEKKPTENVSPATTLSNEKDKGTKSFRSEVTPGRVRIDPEKENASPPTEANKKPLGPRPKKELTFLKTLKEGKKENPPLKIKEKPEKVQKITAKKTEPRKTEPQVAVTIPPRKSTANRYAVQVASFSKKSSAEDLAGKLRKKGYEAYVLSQEIPQRGRWYRVRVGRYSDRAEATREANRIKKSEKFNPLVISDQK